MHASRMIGDRAMEAYLGEIRLFAGTFAPEGWALCDGRSLPVRDYEALYSVIGNLWGGDAQSFQLPNLSGRVPIGSGQGANLTARAVGQTGGAPQVMAEIPPHTHRFMASTLEATAFDPNGMMLAKVTPSGTTSGLYLKPAGTEQTMAAGSVTDSGGGAPHDNMMPSLGLTYIICVLGEYPVRE